jgi:hypothetical protein
MSEKHVPAELRRLVIERAQDCREYCGAQAAHSSDPFTVENLAYLCFGCNQHKSARISAAEPVTESRVPLFHPRRDQ